MNQYDQLSLLYAAVGTFKKAATAASKLIFNDSDYFNANQTGSFASFFIYNNTQQILVILTNNLYHHDGRWHCLKSTAKSVGLNRPGYCFRCGSPSHKASALPLQKG